jgi:hypothetical protein
MDGNSFQETINTTGWTIRSLRREWENNYHSKNNIVLTGGKNKTERKGIAT